jgi:peptidoglycan L-alanyl-D-glutamate endopeptidase CwlK
MKYRYSATSLRRLGTCDPRLVDIFMEVADHIDTTIICGHRSQEDQDAAFRAGKSKVEWPEGKHNSKPSQAVDAAPYPIDWQDRERATLFAGVVLGLAAARGVLLRWGGDWDRDWQVSDNSFDDLWHFELIED